MNAQRRSSAPLPLKAFLRREGVAKRLTKLRKLSPWRFVVAVAFNYGLIAAAITMVLGLASLGANSTLGLVGFGTVYAAAVLLIAARQHALLVLMHEGAHYTISRNRPLNDTLSDLLCGAPMLVSTRSYRQAHLAHHQHLNSAQDPDWTRKVDDDGQRQQWMFPTQQPLWRLLAQLYTQSISYLLKSLIDNQNVSQPPNQPAQPTNQQLSGARYALYAAVAVALTMSASWMGFLLFWVVPMFLVLPMLMRIRSIAEHFALRHDHALSQSRTVRAGRLERLLLAPHHIGLHIDHHLLASVPFFNLPKLHELLLESAYYRENAHLNDGYFLPTRGAGSKQATFASDLYGPASVRLDDWTANRLATTDA